MSEAAAATPAAATESSAKPGLFNKLTVALLLLAILGGEAVVAFCFLPTADEVAAAGRPSKEARGDAHHDELPGLEQEVSDESLKELDLEKYALTIPNMKTGTSYRVDFHLWGVVAAEHEKEFEHLYEEHKHRLRDQIGTIIRRAEPSELAEPGLGLIK